MQTIFRLKRRAEDSPSDTLILNCNKKRKLDFETYQNKDSLLTVLKFSGTLNSQDEDLSKCVENIKSSLKDKFSSDFKKHNVNLNEKLKLEAQKNSKENRYRVINYLRSDLPSECSRSKDFTIYDLEEQSEEPGATSDSNFVYHLYHSDTKVLHNLCDYDDISIYPTKESLVFDSDDVYNLDDESDSDDSNAENNWRNDYPDESDADSINEDDMVAAVSNLGLEDTLSSEDEFAYCTENNGDYYDHDIDSIDKQKHGKLYAHFKAKYKDDRESEEENSFSLSDSD